jgi:F-type H+-transporting ATPase subunit delta
VKASEAVAKSYAKALFELAKQRGVADAIGTELDSLVKLLDDAADLAAVLSRPWIGGEQKRTVAIDVATRAGVSQLARDFFALVVGHGRADHLAAIQAAYGDLVDADAGRVRARVRTAAPLSEDDKRTLAARIGRELGGKQVILEERVDPTMLGGFVAEVGSLVVDGSLEGQLARLRSRLARA